MATIPIAFSVHHFINSVGADAGFASIIGLAILILLYFAQARETASLRTHAYDAAERIQQLEARLARTGPESAAPEISASAPGRAGTAPVPAGARVAAAVPAGVGAAAGAPVVAAPAVAGAPAGVGAPALTAATKLIPTVQPAGAVGLAPERSAEPFAVGAPQPATVAGGGGGSAPVGAPAAPTNGSSTIAPQRPAAATQSPPPRVQIRPGATMPPGRRTPPPRGRGPTGEGNSRRILAIVLAALGVVAIVAILLVVTSGSSNPKSAAGTPPPTSNAGGAARKRAKRSTVNPATVTVAVLNGTNTTGLAARVAQGLQSYGYKQGAIETASDQTHSTTTVGYLPGFKSDGLAVAKSLKVQPNAVQPVDQAAQQVACPSGQACPANVIVTVGADLQNAQ